jgi:hypothetical protein
MRKYQAMKRFVVMSERSWRYQPSAKSKREEEESWRGNLATFINRRRRRRSWLSSAIMTMKSKAEK